jgi:hypothetical protein
VGGFRRGWGFAVGFNVGRFQRALWVGFAVDRVSMWVGFDVRCGWVFTLDGVSPWMGFRCGWVSTCAMGGFSPWMGFCHGFHRGFRHRWVSTYVVGGFRCGRRCRWVSKDHGRRDPSQSADVLA